MWRHIYVSKTVCHLSCNELIKQSANDLQYQIPRFGNTALKFYILILTLALKLFSFTIFVTKPIITWKRMFWKAKYCFWLVSVSCSYFWGKNWWCSTLRLIFMKAIFALLGFGRAGIHLIMRAWGGYWPDSGASCPIYRVSIELSIHPPL